MQIPFFQSLKTSRRVLLAGCGGGFDVVSGIPLYVWLKNAGYELFLANLSFSRLELGCTERIGPSGWLVDQHCAMMRYCPERHLVDWLGLSGYAPQLVGLERTGVRPLIATYTAIIERFAIDTVILVDGGTDSLQKGDEALLGTLEEDATSIVAVNEVACPNKYLVCLGFGIDQYHGICHHSFLENTAEMIRLGGFLGCVSVNQGSVEGDALLAAVDFLNQRQPSHPSIVVNSIASAMRGEFGDHHQTSRTHGTQLFINALMSLYWCYDLPKVAAQMGFYRSLVDSRTFAEVADIIRRYHTGVAQREWKRLPL